MSTGPRWKVENTCPIAQLGEQEDKATVSIAGQFVSVEKKFAKKSGKPFAVVILEDFTGSLEIMIWSETYNSAQKLLEVGTVVSISGRLDLRDEGPKVTANEVALLKKLEPREKPLVLTIDPEKATEKDLLTIRDTIRARPGKRKVELKFERGQEQLRLIPADEFRIDWSGDAPDKLAPWMKS